MNIKFWWAKLLKGENLPFHNYQNQFIQLFAHGSSIHWRDFIANQNMCGVCEKKILCESWLKANQGEVYQTRIYSIIQKQQNDWRNLSLSIHYELKRKYLIFFFRLQGESKKINKYSFFFHKKNLIITLNVPFNI